MIKGKLINLRLIEESDLENIHKLTSDISMRGEYWPLTLRSKVGLKKRYHENGMWSNDFGTMIILNKASRIVGEITYFKGLWYMPGYEIGYQIYDNKDRGKGYTTEALKIFCSFLFEEKPINRLEIEVSVGNIASRKVAEKCGFKFEGIKRQAVFSRGKYEDIELLALLKDECPSLKELLNYE